MDAKDPTLGPRPSIAPILRYLRGLRETPVFAISAFYYYSFHKTGSPGRGTRPTVDSPGQGTRPTMYSPGVIDAAFRPRQVKAGEVFAEPIGIVGVFPFETRYLE